MPPDRASRAALVFATCLLAATTLASAPPPRALPLGRADDSSGCCGPAGLVCSGDNFTGLVEKQLYFVHPRSAGGTFGWGNHNLADALGDAAFLCVDGSFVSRFNDSLISTVVMRWNASYVNYAECDDIEGGKCIFGDGIGVGVGRINPFYWPGKGTACGFPDGTGVTGQCWRNLSGGEWLSFQKPGQCKPGARVGDGGCAWVRPASPAPRPPALPPPQPSIPLLPPLLSRGHRAAQEATGPPSKTIELGCMLGHGFQRACKNATLVPGIGCVFGAARDIFVQAFASDDPEDGGCPPVH